MIEKYPALGVPNQFFMSLVGLLGVLLLLGNIVVIVFICANGSLATDIQGQTMEQSEVGEPW